MATKKKTRAAAHNESGVESAGDVQEQHEELMRVQLGPVSPKGYYINGHTVQDGQHVLMYPSEIDKHRDGGIPLLDVEEPEGGHEDEALDVSVPYEAAA